MQGMQLSGLACRVTSHQSWKEDCMTEMHLLCIYVRGFQLDNTRPKVIKGKLQIGRKMSAMNAYPWTASCPWRTKQAVLSVE